MRDINLTTGDESVTLSLVGEVQLGASDAAIQLDVSAMALQGAPFPFDFDFTQSSGNSGIVITTQSANWRSWSGLGGDGELATWSPFVSVALVPAPPLVTSAGFDPSATVERREAHMTEVANDPGSTGSTGSFVWIERSVSIFGGADAGQQVGRVMWGRFDLSRLDEQWFDAANDNSGSIDLTEIADGVLGRAPKSTLLSGDRIAVSWIGADDALHGVVIEGSGAADGSGYPNIRKIAGSALDIDPGGRRAQSVATSGGQQILLSMTPGIAGGVAVYGLLLLQTRDDFAQLVQAAEKIAEIPDGATDVRILSAGGVGNSLTLTWSPAADETEAAVSVVKEFIVTPGADKLFTETASAEQTAVASGLDADWLSGSSGHVVREAAPLTTGDDAASSDEAGATLLSGTDGDDVIDASASDVGVTILAGDGDDIVIGSSHGDHLSGGGGNDALYGRDGDDTLDGGGDDDELDGGGGNDALYGRDGDDTLDGGGDDDELDGGGGYDIIIGGGDSRPEDSGSSDYSASSEDSGGDSYSGSATASAQAGSGTPPALAPASAAPTPDSAVASDSSTPNAQAGSGSPPAAAAPIPVPATASAAPAGASPGTGDTVSYEEETEGFRIDLDEARSDVDIDGDGSADQTTGTARRGDGEDAPSADAEIEDHLLGIENVEGSQASDVVSGDSGSNYLSGNDGDDAISGRDGNDTLVGGEGDDTLDGGGGRDVLVDGVGDDTIAAGDDDDTIFATDDDGHDVIDGGEGTDTAVYSGDRSGYDSNYRWDGRIDIDRRDDDSGHGSDDDNDDDRDDDDCDSYSNVELFRFGDDEVDIAALWRDRVIVNPDIVETTEDTPVSLMQLLGGAGDEDGSGSGLSIIRINGIEIDPDGGTGFPGIRVGSGDGGGYVISSPETGQLMFVPDADHEGIVTFEYTVGDGSGDYATLLAIINVIAETIAEGSLSFADGSTTATVAEGISDAILGALALGDFDSDAQGNLSFAVYESDISGPSDRFVADSGTLQLIEALDHAEDGEITLQVVATDEHGATYEQELTIDVRPLAEIIGEQLDADCLSFADTSSDNSGSGSSGSSDDDSDNSGSGNSGSGSDCDRSDSDDRDSSGSDDGDSSGSGKSGNSGCYSYEEVMAVIAVDNGSSDVSHAIMMWAAQDTLDFKPAYANDNVETNPWADDGDLIDLSGTYYSSLDDLLRLDDPDQAGIRQDGDDVVILVNPGDPCSAEIRIPDTQLSALVETDFKFH